MSEYKKPYLILMNACEDAVRALEKGNVESALMFLIRGQRQAEEVFLENTDDI